MGRWLEAVERPVSSPCAGARGTFQDRGDGGPTESQCPRVEHAVFIFQEFTKRILSLFVFLLGLTKDCKLY